MDASRARRRTDAREEARSEPASELCDEQGDAARSGNAGAREGRGAGACGGGGALARRCSRKRSSLLMRLPRAHRLRLLGKRR
eukprot:3684414-Rhodomonas_salina.4